MRPLAILLALVLAAPAAAQQDVYMVRSAPGWLGITYELRWVQADSGCSPQVMVEAVVQGSPADRAGLRAGDTITALDGDPVPPGRLQALAARLMPGDSVRLRFRRDGVTREVTAVADRRPDRPLSVFVERTPEPRGYRNGAAPLIELVGNTLVARNVGVGWDPGRTRSYWLRRSDGRTEYRTLGGWSSSDIDRRVAELLACADSAAFDAPTRDRGAAINLELRRVQQRADSIRMAISRRLLQRADSLRAATLRADTLRAEGTGPDGRRTFRVEDHVAAGMRGVAGAEITALEPELAGYFPNADRGLLVLRIAPDTPAHRAGLRPGDVVISAGGRRVESVAELREIVALPDARAVELRVIRHGRTRDLSLRRD